MRSVPLVRLFWVHPILQFFREAGAPVDRYLEEARLPAEVDQELDLAFPSPPLYDVIDRLVGESGYLDLGLTLGTKVRMRNLGPFGQQVASQPTLREAIEIACELMPAVHSARRLTLSESGDMARLACRVNTHQLMPVPLWDDQFTLSMLIDLVRSVAGIDWLPNKATVQSDPWGPWPMTFGFGEILIRGGAEATAIEFPRGLLERRLTTSPERPDFESQAQHDLVTLPTDLAGCVQVTLRALLVQGRFDLATLACAVGSSVRTLQRRLSERDRSFRDLLAEARLGVAHRRLRDPSAQVIDVAFEAGYSDPSHFTRAFRNWTGETPMHYRRSHSATLSQAGPTP